MADDYYHLHESMRDVYVYLLIGYVDPEYLNRGDCLRTEV